MFWSRIDCSNIWAAKIGVNSSAHMSIRPSEDRASFGEFMCCIFPSILLAMLPTMHIIVVM